MLITFNTLSSLDLNLELTGRHARDLGGDHGVDPEVGQGATHQSAREGHELGAGLQVLPVLACLGEELEAVVLQDVDPLVVGPQVVYLLPEHGNPEVLADELQKIQFVLEFGVIAGQSLNKPVASVVTEQLELGACSGVTRLQILGLDLRY